MLAFFANLFGYVLNFLYEICKNYGIAIILFSITVKLIMLPLSIKQQKTVRKSNKVQNEMKQIQFKYRNNQDKMNQEMMDLYRRENMSPLSGCLSSIIQIVLLFSIFYLVRSPLTYMEKIDTDAINEMKEIIQQDENAKIDTGYPEIAIIKYAREHLNPESLQSVNGEHDEENVFEKYKDKLDLNMDFFGIDLSKVAKDDLKDWKVWIIPVLYVISSFGSMKLTAAKQNNKNNKLITDGKEEKEEIYDAMGDTNKMMSWMMPIMSISIACIAPLGLALYWFMNNVLMIVEKIIIDKFMKDEEEAVENV